MSDEEVQFLQLLGSRGNAKPPFAVSCVPLWREQYLVVCFLSQEYLGGRRLQHLTFILGFPGGSDGEEFSCSAGDPGSIPGSGRCPGEWHGNPLQYSCLGTSVGGGTWKATVHAVAKSWKQLNDQHFHLGGEVMLMAITITCHWHRMEK